MAKHLKTSGKIVSVTDSSASPNSKVGFYVVSKPLTRSEVDWLKQQSKHMAVVSSQRSELRINTAVSVQMASVSGKVLSDRKSSKSIAALALTQSRIRSE